MKFFDSLKRPVSTGRFIFGSIGSVSIAEVEEGQKNIENSRYIGGFVLTKCKWKNIIEIERNIVLLMCFEELLFRFVELLMVLSYIRILF